MGRHVPRSAPPRDTDPISCVISSRQPQDRGHRCASSVNDTVNDDLKLAHETCGVVACTRENPLAKEISWVLEGCVCRTVARLSWRGKRRSAAAG